MLHTILDNLFNWPALVQVFGFSFEEGLKSILLLLGIIWVGYTQLLPARPFTDPDGWGEDSIGHQYGISGILQFSLAWGLGVWVIASLLFLSLYLEEWNIDEWGLGIGLFLLIWYFNAFRLIRKNIIENATVLGATFIWVFLGLFLSWLVLSGTRLIFWCLFSFVLLVSFYRLVLQPSYIKQLFVDLNLPQKMANTFCADVPLKVWISCVVGFSALLVFVCTIAYFFQSPYGGIDAYMIWNLHAKILASGGTEWHRLFDSRWPWWNENHYPPLLSSIVATGWYVSGSFSQWFPFLIACGFGISTLGLLYGFLTRLKAHWVGVGAGFILICTPFYWELLAQQLADVPMGYFVLAMVGSLIMGTGVPDIDSTGLKNGHNKARFQLKVQWLLLSGCFAGLALLTKQEGILLVFSSGIAWLWCLVFKLKSTQYKLKAGFALGWLIGLCPAVLMWLWYRNHSSPHPNIYFSQPIEKMWYSFLDVHRHAVIWRTFWQDCFTGFSGLLGLFWFGMLWVLFPKDWRPWQTDAFRFGLLVVVILGLLYALTYLLTPYPLEWQLYFSARRLWIHLWPTMILLACWLLDWPGPIEDCVPRKQTFE